MGPQGQQPQPATVARWGALVALVVGCLAVATWLGLSPPWQSRAEAQQQATAGSAALRAAQSECQAQLQLAVGAQTQRLTTLEARVIRLEESQRWTLYLLQQLAAQQGLPSTPLPSALLPQPGSAPPGGPGGPP